MNLKLASQVLSSSVSCALTFCETLDSEFTNVKSTAEFCMIMNNAFDILNCRTKYSKSPFNLALSPSTFDKYLDFTNKFEKYVHSLILSSGQKVVESLRKTGFVGIVWGLKNLINYYTFLKNKKYDIEYILSYKLSQDHLETFFSSIRSRGGYNNNPSCKEFKISYKKLLVHHHVSGSQYGNCLPESMLKNTTISESDSILLDDDECNDNLEFTQSDDHDHNYIETYLKSSPFIAGVTDYISGFIAKKVAKKINCDICKTFLIDNSNNRFLIKLKDRNNALVKPSKDVSYICKVVENKIKCKDLKYIFAKNFMNKIYLETKREVYGGSVFSGMDNHVSGQSLFTNHRDQLLTLIISSYVHLKLKSIGKQQEKMHLGTRKKLTKFILFNNE